MNDTFLAGHESKDLLFADDESFILDGSKKPFETLLDIMDNFSSISGLKFNTKKMSNTSKWFVKNDKYNTLKTS